MCRSVTAGDSLPPNLMLSIGRNQLEVLVNVKVVGCDKPWILKGCCSLTWLLLMFLLLGKEEREGEILYTTELIQTRGFLIIEIIEWRQIRR